MEYSDYLREQADEYRRLAESSEDPIEKEDLFELAAIYEMVANDLDDRRARRVIFWVILAEIPIEERHVPLRVSAGGKALATRSGG